MKNLIPFLLSILLHLTLASIVVNAPKPEPKSEQILVELIESDFKRPLKQKEVAFDNQAPETEKPQEAEYYGKKNVKVKKQTIAKDKSQILRVGKKEEKKTVKKIDLKDLTNNSYVPKMLDRIKKIEETEKKEEYRDGALLNLADFKDKIARGGQTALNTQELVYFSFYDRIRLSLEPKWLILMEEYKQKGLYISKNSKAHSEVTVKLNREGQIIGTELTRGSGNLNADTLAMEAFASLNTIPNPPRGVFEGKKYLYITWGFTIYRN